MPPDPAHSLFMCCLALQQMTQGGSIPVIIPLVWLPPCERRGVDRGYVKFARAESAQNAFEAMKSIYMLLLLLFNTFEHILLFSQKFGHVPIESMFSQLHQIRVFENNRIQLGTQESLNASWVCWNTWELCVVNRRSYRHFDGKLGN